MQFTPRQEAYFPAIVAAGVRLLKMLPENETPDLILEAALCLGEGRYGTRSVRDASIELGRAIRKTFSRRRSAFWYVVERFKDDPRLGDQGIQWPLEMDRLGWSAELHLEDLDWLLADGPSRSAENERCLAIRTALLIWKGADSDQAILARIRSVAQAEGAMWQAYQAFLEPRHLSSAELEMTRQHEEIVRRRANDESAAIQELLEFVSSLQGDIESFRKAAVSSADDVDRRVYRLWQLLNDAAYRNNRHTVDSVAPLVPLTGAELADVLRDALIHHWRVWRPTLRSSKEPGQKNRFSSGAVGSTSPLWTRSLV